MPDPKLFDISDQCPPEQKRMFEAINECLKTIGLSADEYDRFFRAVLMQDCCAIAASSLTGILAKSDPRNSEFIKNPDLEEWYKTNTWAKHVLDSHKLYTNLLGSDGLVDITLASRLDTPEQIIRLSDKVAEEDTKEKFLSGVIAKLNKQIGRFQDIPSPQGGILEKMYQTFNEFAKLPLRSTPSSENLLQTFASGTPLVSGKNDHFSYEINGSKFETAGMLYYIGNALIDAFQAAMVKSKSADERQRLTEAFSPHADVIFENINKLGGVDIERLGVADIQVARSGNNPVVSQQAFFKQLHDICYANKISPELFDYNLRNVFSRLLVHSGIRAYAETAKLMEQDLGGIYNTNTTTGNTSFDKAVAKLAIKSIHSEDSEASPAAAIPDTVTLFTLQAALSQELVQQLTKRFPYLTNQKLNEDISVVPPEAAEQVNKKIEEIMAYTGDIYKKYDAKTRLLGGHENNKQLIFELNNRPTAFRWQNYRIEMPSEQEFLITAIKETIRLTLSYDSLRGRDRQNIDKALRQLEESYAIAQRSPQQWEEIRMQEKQEQERQAERERERLAIEQKRIDDAKAFAAQKAAQIEESKKLALAEQERQAEQAKLNFIPFKPTGMLQSIISRSIDPSIGETAISEIAPLIANLNSNFAPHKSLGDTLFTEGNGHIMRTVDYLCGTGKLPTPQTEVHTHAAEKIKQLLTMQLDESPVHNANRKYHDKAVETLSAAPIMLIAALGTLSELQEAKQIQERLYPARGKKPDDDTRAGLKGAQAALAVQILEREKMPIPDALREKAKHAALPQEPPKKPKQPPKPPSPHATKPLSSPPAPAVTAPTTPPENPVPPITAPAALAAAALVATEDTKHSLQDTKLVSPPVAELSPPPVSVVTMPVITVTPSPSGTKARNGSRNGSRDIQMQLDTFVQNQLKEKPPYNMLRCNLSLEAGYPLTISLSRTVNGETSGKSRIQTRTTTLRLNKQDIEEALQLKQEIQSNLLAPGTNIYPYRHIHGDHILAGSEDVLPFRSPDRDKNGLVGRRIPRSGVCSLELKFPANGQKDEASRPVRTEGILSLGLRQDGDEEEAKHRQQLVTKYIDKLLADPEKRHFTMQDLRLMLQDKVAHEGGRWDYAEKIDLSQHPEIDNEIVIDFPSKESKTIIQVNNPVREGSPNSYWRLPLVIGTTTRESEKLNDWRLITKRSVNMHISDPEVAKVRVGEILRHLKASLEAHAENYPGAKWQLDDKDKLDNSPPNISGNIINIDGAAWEHIVARLGYVGQTSAHISDISEHGDRTHFKLALQRADATPFLARTNLPAAYDCSIPTKETAQETKEAINAFHQNIQAKFGKYMETHFKGHTEDIDGKPVYHPLKEYNASSIAKDFDDIVKAVAPQLRVEATRHKVSGVSGGAGYQPGSPKQHHADLNHEDGDFHRNRIKNRNPGFDHGLV